jgi:hypothetical protein
MWARGVSYRWGEKHTELRTPQGAAVSSAAKLSSAAAKAAGRPVALGGRP